MVRITNAQKEHAEQIAELFNMAYGNSYSLQEYSQMERIEKTLDKSNQIWKVAVSDDRIVGNMVGSLLPKNRSYEGGKLVIHPDFRGKRLGTEFHFTIMEEAFQNGYDIVYYTMREHIGVKAASKTLGLTLCGYLPGKHEVRFRENHPFYVNVSDKFCKQRIACMNCNVYNNPFVHKVVSSLGLNKRKGKYPDTITASSTIGKRVELKHGSLEYSFHERDKSLTICNLVSDNPDLLIEEIMVPLKGHFVLPEFHRTSYIEIDVLVHNDEFIKKLESLDFERYVFLPGWHLENDKRYDCIRFCKTQPFSLDNSVNNVVQDVNRYFRNRSYYEN